MNLIWLLLSCFTVVQSQQTYKAAVVQMKPSRKNDITPPRVVLDNAQSFVAHIDKAKQKGANIIVFPENGLTTLEPVTLQSAHLYLYSVQFKLNDVPCDEKEDKPLKTISCAAKKNGIYVALNVLEMANNDTFYNTDVVIDDKGKIIRSYRKRNLQNEKLYTAGNKDEVFTINVGGKDVTFGILIGSDVLHSGAFNTASKATDIIYSTSLMSELPYFNGLSLQMGFALANDINLLASSYYSLENGISGSGIYHYDGNIPDVVSFEESYLIISDLPITTKDQKEGCKLAKIKNVIGNQSQVSSFKYKSLDLKNFNKTKPLTSQELDDKLCDGDMCCVFKGKFEKEPSGFEIAYYKGPQQGLGIKGSDTSDIFACHIITVCLKTGNCSDGPGQIKVNNLEVKAEFKENSFVLPLALTNDFVPLKQVSVCKTKESLSISVNETSSSALFMGHYMMSSSAAFEYNVAYLIGSVSILLVLIFCKN